MSGIGRNFHPPGAWLAGTLALLGPCSAERSARAEDGASYALHGFVLVDAAFRVSGRNPPGLGDVAFAEERARLEATLEAADVDAAARFKLDAFDDPLEERAGIELREAYIDYRAGPFDFRLGRQVLSWGVGDLQFINDVFPKDYAAFFLGRPIEYLKVPNDALRTTLTFEPVAVDWVAIPFVASDGVPGRDRFAYGFDPFASIGTQRSVRPEPSWRNTEFAARLRVSLSETDLALYAFRGFFHTPSLVPDDPIAPKAVTALFPALDVYGASLQRNLLGGVFSAEAGYYRSRHNARSDDPLLPASRAKWLAGYQSEVITDLTLGAQYIGQWMLHHPRYRESLPPGVPLLDAYVQTVTVRLTLFLFHQTLRLSAFAFAGITERDLLAIPEAEYKVSDRLSLVLGSNIFAGARPHTTFGVFRANSNVYTWARFSF